jgi:succinate-acetate transporter protein
MDGPAPPEDDGPAPRVNAAATRLVLRPLATPLPLGFLGLFFATMLVSGIQLGWVPVRDQRDLAVGILVLTVPVQFIACVYGFLVRDLVAGTGMGLLAGTWGTVALVLLLSPQGSTNAGLAWVLVLAGTALLVPASAAAHAKVLAATVIMTTAVRFWVTAAYEWGAPHAWETAAGGVGIALGVLALYAALAFEIEDQRRRTVLPTLRRKAGKEAMTAGLAYQVGQAANEAGVRKVL